MPNKVIARRPLTVSFGRQKQSTLFLGLSESFLTILIKQLSLNIFNQHCDFLREVFMIPHKKFKKCLSFSNSIKFY